MKSPDKELPQRVLIEPQHRPRLERWLIEGDTILVYQNRRAGEASFGQYHFFRFKKRYGDIPQLGSVLPAKWCSAGVHWHFLLIAVAHDMSLFEDTFQQLPKNPD